MNNISKMHKSLLDDLFTNSKDKYSGLLANIRLDNYANKDSIIKYLVSKIESINNEYFTNSDKYLFLNINKSLTGIKENINKLNNVFSTKNYLNILIICTFEDRFDSFDKDSRDNYLNLFKQLRNEGNTIIFLNSDEKISNSLLIPTKLLEGTNIYLANQSNSLENIIEEVIDRFTDYDINISINEKEAISHFLIQYNKETSKSIDDNFKVILAFCERNSFDEIILDYEGLNKLGEEYGINLQR